MNDSSSIRISKNGAVAVTGPDAILLYKALALRSALQLYAKTKIRPTRHIGPTDMLELAGEFSRRKYKRGAFAEAISDLTVWIDTMKAALPIIDEGEE
jgi:hypothetical protein